MSIRIAASAALVAFSLSASSFGAVVYSETVTGDLSNDRANPTAIAALPQAGSSQVSGASGPNDRDYFRLTIPAGSTLTQIRLIAYSNESGVSFLGMQSGNAITVDPNAGSAAGLLGWTHFGTANVGTNMFSAIGSGAGASGFTNPLPAGNYSFWIQEISSTATWTWEFVTIPAPGAAALLAPAMMLTGRRRR